MKFGNMFTGIDMRSPSIDWWNQDKPYHKPEYVSMMALNQHGQLLWAIDFFTNDTNANIGNWMRKDRVLPNEFLNTSSIETLNITINTTNNEIRITESESDYVWFQRGNVNNDKAIVTVVSPKKIPIPVFFTSNKSMDCLPTYAVCTCDHQKLEMKYFQALKKTECNCSNDVHGNCIRYFWNGDAVCPWQLENGNTGCRCCPLTEFTCSNKIYENANELMNTSYREIQDTVIFEVSILVM
ncbi:uncharacterized protein LOC134233415 [Saccostrea cucullata]|uniref:uncharacterized protein LOC134233415 n=1 Tax=Saccostrea cuccullata TaxID=36930 RepID=UPI002ED5F081